MFHIVLVEPEIPPNTGNIIRLCANAPATLHLIKPLGFILDDKRLRRAGLDYHEWASVQIHEDIESFLAKVKPSRVFAYSTHGSHCYADVSYKPGDALFFGPETRGLAKDFLATLDKKQVLRVPMKTESRSLNLSNTVALVLYEAWRQQNFSQQ